MFLYKQYDQELLDRQYNNRLHVPEFEDYFTRWNLLSRETEDNLSPVKDLAYGDKEREKLDVYPAARPNAKTLIFIHGGYWQMLDKNMFSFFAGSFHQYGVTTVLINYPLAPAASMNEIVSCCTRAIEWLWKNISAFNGDPNQMYVVGHSAGGHLAAMLMTADWKSLHPDLPADIIKGTCAISGLFNLVPIQLSFLNKVLKLDLNAAVQNSPVSLKPINCCNMVLAVGDAETTEFNEQSEELEIAWKKHCVSIQLLKLGTLNHYSIIESVRHSESELHQAILQLMGM
ncbi:MAG TPA: alpha/beta hydrolase [Segetibacter sp.]|nr:alpha/beta hydrolase [Segetibacter sp.]